MVFFTSPSPTIDEVTSLCKHIYVGALWRTPQHWSIVCPPKLVPFILLSKTQSLSFRHGFLGFDFHLFLSLVLFFWVPLDSMLDPFMDHPCPSFRAQPSSQDSVPGHFYFWKKRRKSPISSPFYFSTPLTKLVSRIDLAPFYPPWTEYTPLSSVNPQIVSTSQGPYTFSIKDWIPHPFNHTSYLSSLYYQLLFNFLYQSLFSLKTPMALQHQVNFPWIA